MLKRLMIFLLISGAFYSCAGFCSERKAGWHLAGGPQFAFIKDYGFLMGSDLSLRYEHRSRIGGMAAFSAMMDINEFYNCARHKERSIESILNEKSATYYSFLIGPTYRINDSWGVYGLVGRSKSTISMPPTSKENTEKITDTKRKSKPFAYRLGVNHYISERYSISAGYERSKTSFMNKGYSIHTVFLNSEIKF